MNNLPTLDQLQQYTPNVPGQVEGIKSSLYDTLAYPTTGVSQLIFFQTPKGQNGKTFAQTNMTNAGMLPAPQAFLVQTIELYFLPGSLISNHGAGAASGFINDSYAFYTQPGWLEFFVAAKSYLDEAPLMKFPPMNGMSGFAALSDSTTAGAAQGTSVAYGTAGGPVYELNPPLMLTQSMNFNISLNWPALVPVGTAATVVCQMGGLLYRNAQ